MHALWHALQANYSRVLAWVCSHAIVSSLVGPEYYVNIMSFVDKSQLEPGCSILLHNKVCWRHNVCTDIAVYLLCFLFLMSLSGMAGAVSRGHSAGRSRSNGLCHEGAISLACIPFFTRMLFEAALSLLLRRGYHSEADNTAQVFFGRRGKVVLV